MEIINQYRKCLPANPKDRNEDKISFYESKGIKVIRSEAKDDRISIPKLMEDLGKMQIDSILLEGGATLNWSFISEGMVNKVYTYIAPKIFGGEKAKTPVAGKGFPAPGEALRLKDLKMIRLGEDILTESRIDKGKINI